MSGLVEWTDWDGAAFEVGKALGFWDDVDPASVKGLLWTDTGAGRALDEILDLMVKVGVLERRNEPDIQFRRGRKEDLRLQ